MCVSLVLCVFVGELLEVGDGLVNLVDLDLKSLGEFTNQEKKYRKAIGKGPFVCAGLVRLLFALFQVTGEMNE